MGRFCLSYSDIISSYDSTTCALTRVVLEGDLGGNPGAITGKPGQEIRFDLHRRGSTFIPGKFWLGRFPSGRPSIRASFKVYAVWCSLDVMINTTGGQSIDTTMLNVCFKWRPLIHLSPLHYIKSKTSIYKYALYECSWLWHEHWVVGRGAPRRSKGACVVWPWGTGEVVGGWNCSPVVSIKQGIHVPRAASLLIHPGICFWQRISMSSAVKWLQFRVSRL